MFILGTNFGLFYLWIQYWMQFWRALWVALKQKEEKLKCHSKNADAAQIESSAMSIREVKHVSKQYRILHQESFKTPRKFSDPMAP